MNKRNIKIPNTILIRLGAGYMEPGQGHASGFEEHFHWTTWHTTRDLNKLASIEVKDKLLKAVAEHLQRLRIDIIIHAGCEYGIDIKVDDLEYLGNLMWAIK